MDEKENTASLSAGKRNKTSPDSKAQYGKKGTKTQFVSDAKDKKVHGVRSEKSPAKPRALKLEKMGRAATSLGLQDSHREQVREDKIALQEKMSSHPNQYDGHKYRVQRAYTDLARPSGYHPQNHDHHGHHRSHPHGQEQLSHDHGRHPNNQDNSLSSTHDRGHHGHQHHHDHGHRGHQRHQDHDHHGHHANDRGHRGRHHHHDHGHHGHHHTHEHGQHGHQEHGHHYGHVSDHHGHHYSHDHGHHGHHRHHDHGYQGHHPPHDHGHHYSHGNHEFHGHHHHDYGRHGSPNQSHDTHGYAHNGHFHGFHAYHYPNSGTSRTIGGRSLKTYSTISGNRRFYSGDDYSVCSACTDIAWENTYKTEPDEGVASDHIKKIIVEVLKERLQDKKYDALEMQLESRAISDIIKDKVKALRMYRYKLVCLIFIGQEKKQSVQIGSRCLWDHRYDSFATATVRFGDFYATGMVFATYFE